ncbi:MAG: hypothetical protein GXO85_07710 [Chlorobi bacterium]|nr:hypothetical protein [Chlorobiota bacterium]
MGKPELYATLSFTPKSVPTNRIFLSVALSLCTIHIIEIFGKPVKMLVQLAPPSIDS